VDDETSSESASFRMRDVLERETIDKIEELHGAVVRAEAEQRFGLLRGKRSRSLVEAEAVEQTFLQEHGFDSYNDFRLRIRRSTSLGHPEPAAPTFAWDDDNDHGLSTGTAGTETETETETGTDTGADEAFRDPESSQEGREQMGPLPDPAPAQAAPPPPIPATAPRGDSDNVASASNDFRRLTEPLFATLQAETDKFLAARIEAAERQAAEILNRASKEAAEIIGRAARMHEAVKSLVEDVTRQSEAFLGLTEELPVRLGEIRENVAADLQALRELADSGPPKAPSPSEPSGLWSAPPRVAPPPPVPTATPVSVD
jgi:vacuolar-type H+-ATPase subunit H